MIWVCQQIGYSIFKRTNNEPAPTHLVWDKPCYSKQNSEKKMNIGCIQDQTNPQITPNHKHSPIKINLTWMSTNSDNPRSTFNRHQDPQRFPSHFMSRHIVLIAEGAFGFQQRTALRIILLRKINGFLLGHRKKDQWEIFRIRFIGGTLVSTIFWAIFSGDIPTKT